MTDSRGFRHCSDSLWKRGHFILFSKFFLSSPPFHKKQSIMVQEFYRALKRVDGRRDD